MRNKILILLLAMAVLVGCVGCGKSTETADKSTKEYLIGTDGETPGYSALNDKNELEGYEIDFWNEVAKRYDVKVKFVQMPFSTLFGELDNGKLDTIANSIGPNAERKEKYDFSDSYIYEEHVLMSAPDLKAKTFKDLDGMSVGVVSSSLDDGVIDKIEKDAGIKMERIPYEDTARNDVIAKKVDLCIQPMGMAMDAAKRIGKDKIKVLMGTGQYSESAYPFAKSDDSAEFKELTNKAIKEMREDGTLKKLSMKWFDTDLTELPKN